MPTLATFQPVSVSHEVRSRSPEPATYFVMVRALFSFLTVRFQPPSALVRDVGVVALLTVQAAEAASGAARIIIVVLKFIVVLLVHQALGTSPHALCIILDFPDRCKPESDIFRKSFLAFCAFHRTPDVICLPHEWKTDKNDG